MTSFTISEDRRRTIRLVNVDKKGPAADRRKEFRIICTFPAKLKINNATTSLPRDMTVKTMDMNNKGIKLMLDYFIPPSSPVNIVLDLSPHHPPLELEAKTTWSKLYPKTNKYHSGLNFIKDNKNLATLEKIFNDFKNTISTRPKIQFIKRPLNVCHQMWGVDFQTGCEFKCLYCYFNKIPERSMPSYFNNQCVDISPIYQMKTFPSLIYLSPFSEPFSSSTKEIAHEFLSFLLPRGVNFWILTKGIIPDKTISLIKSYHSQVEIGIGVTNLDEQRNRILEPYCPTAQERLSNLPRLTNTGCSLWIRMDPIIPQIDDPYDVLKATIMGIAKIGVPVNFSASYLFLTPTSLRAMNRIPYLKKSVKLFTEKSPTSTGMALSIPFEAKKSKYDELFSLCESIGSKMNICSCKDVRFKALKGVGYNLRCWCR